MPVTTLHKLIGLSVALLGQAPGTELLNQWTRLYTRSREDGMDAMAALSKVAQHILNSAAFAEVHPAYLIIDNQDFAQRFLDSVLGATASADMVKLVVGLLNNGTSRAEVAVRAVEHLLEVNQQGSDHADYPTFGTYAMRFGNQVEVARYYTVDKKWMTPNESVLNGVDATAASVTAAKTLIDGIQQPGRNFTLTTGVDQFTGTPGDDTFVATESTLNGADRLHGKAGMDTLELSSGSGTNKDISIPVGAKVEGIETLSVSSDGDFRGDVSQWEGLKTVQLEVVKDVDLELDADAGIKVTSESVGDEEDASTVTIENAGMVMLEGVGKHARVNILGKGTTSVMVEGGKGVKVNTKDSPSMTVNSVTIDGVARDNGEDKKRGGTGDNEDKASVEVYSKALANIALHNTDAIVLVQNDARDMTGLKAMVNKFGSSAGMGKLCLQGIEDLMLQVAGDSSFDLASNEIKMIDVSGAGDLTLDVNKFDNSTASTTLESLLLSGAGKFTMADASGLSKLKTIDGSDASGAVKISKLGDSVTSYQGSSGKDTISVTAFAQAGLKAKLGAGDDSFRVDGTANSKSRIDGGAGRDTLVLTSVKNATYEEDGETKSIYTGFESVSLDVGSGSGTYDVEAIENLDKLIVRGATEAITFKNVMSGTDLSVANKMPDTTTNKSVATASTVSYTLADEAFGARFDGNSNRNGLFTLHVHTNGGKQDEKGDLDTLSKSKTKLTFTVDAEVESMIVHSTATANSTVATDKRPKVGDYTNWLLFSKGDNIEELKVTGDAPVHIGRIDGVSANNAKLGLQSLRYVDARESTGGLRLDIYSNSSKDVEVHGSSAADVVFTGGKAAGDDKLMGYGGDDVLIGNHGSDMFTGGAGGDFLVAGRVSVGKNSLKFSLSADAAAQNETNPTTAVDTLIYTAASDSRVDLDEMTGFDKIIEFDQGVDKIKLSSVPGLDLQGTIKTLANSGNTKSLKTIIGDGDGLFESDYNPVRLDKQKHSVVLVTTTEAKANFTHPQFLLRDSLSAISGNNITVTWVLVDYDGDGDFAASTDMAIALIQPDGTLTASDFI